MTDLATGRTTILIADDHLVLAEGLAATLSSHFIVVGNVPTLEHLRAAIESSKPDVVILDISFHGVSSIPLLAKLTADPSIQARFVMLTGLESTALASAAFEAGAMAFLLKGAGTQELRLAIEAALQGRRFSAGAELKPSLEEPSDAHGPALRVGGLLLRPRQVEILCLMLEGLTRPQAGRRLGISTKGVDYHLNELRERLGLPTLRMLLKWAAGHETELGEALTRVQPKA
ncbi:MAG: response regulator transcription factor [Gemmatimonadales bacterium]|nr:response regulator transcription factor [Gemmatimonadales bacterium]